MGKNNLQTQLPKSAFTITHQWRTVLQTDKPNARYC